MKTNIEHKKKSEIELMREIRDKISSDIQGMTFEQMKKYIEERLTLHPKSVWEKGKNRD